MEKKGKERVYEELEKFVSTRLRPFVHSYKFIENNLLTVEDRLAYMEKAWEENERQSEKQYSFPQLTNHEICHEMFWNAFRGRSKMYIQIPNLTLEENLFSDNWKREREYRRKDSENEEVITFSCTLLTLQMLDYDAMIFRAMTDQDDDGDDEYRDATIKYYRPYLFDYVLELNQEKYKKLQEIQKWKYRMSTESSVRDEPYIWMTCTFNFDHHSDMSLIDFEGYVVQSASSIEKIKADLSIIEDDGSSLSVRKDVLANYNLQNPCIRDDEFCKKLQYRLDSLSSIYVYRIGNGNCVYAENKTKDKCFFYDIGFNYRHRPKKLSTKSAYNYSSAMKKIFANTPSFFILSHWDMDHIAGSFAATKSFLDKKWFVPDCADACVSAQRLAKYLDLKGNLYRVERSKGRMIGKIYIENNIIYKLYMGEKVACDTSRPNCEGIVIKYEDMNTTLLMMGDVNYASFNKAVNNYNKTLGNNVPEPLFADTLIDYLIVPHHGSEHTDYNLITENKPIIKGAKAIICCTDNKEANRPNYFHKEKLKKRFNVFTTESDAKKIDYIKIQL